MRFLVLLFIVVGSAAYADSSSLNLQLPGIGNNYQSDKFRAGELDCSNAIGSATNLEFGVTGIIDKEYYDPQQQYMMGGQTDVGVFARITIPLGKRTKSRIDCNRLYELELRKKQLEVIKLEKELEQLRKLQFEE